MIKLPENKNDFNLTNAEYMALSKEERIFLDDNLPSNIWEFFSEENPDIEKPKLPCVMNGIILGE